MIQLEGHLGPALPADKGVTNLWLSHKGKRLQFQATKLRVLTGTRTESRILSALQPYRPSLFLRGAETMVQRLDAATPTDRITIKGYLRAGARDLMVTEVTVSAPAKPTVKPTGAAPSPSRAGAMSGIEQ